MFDASLPVILVALSVAAVLLAALPLWRPTAEPQPAGAADVGIGTVRTVAGQVVVEVESVCGERFIGRLHCRPTDPAIRPGVLLMVAFDPAAPEQLSLADDILAVRAAYETMLLRKGLLRRGQLDLIRTGVRTCGLVTAARATGEARHGYHEIELDLIVSRPEGGQFAAEETVLLPAAALEEVKPGSVVAAFYRSGDESTVAVSVPG